MSQWYLSYDGSQIGPFDLAAASVKARANPNGYAWREGFAEWVPIPQVSELTQAPSAGGAQPPPLSVRSSDEIDFKILGSEMQFVEIELDPGESAIAEAGAMMYKSASIEMESVFGDSSSTSQSAGLVDKLLGAGKRLLTGENLFTTIFTHTGQGKAHVAFAAPYPGNIIPLTLSNIGGTIICQKDSFLCAARGVSIGIFFQRKILTGLFGGEGFIMQRLDGDGMVFMHAGGSVVERELKAGETIHADTGCVVAFEPRVDFSVQQAGNIKTLIFGGEGLFVATLTGPGKIWLQSLPFSRLAGRVLAGLPRQKEQGSVLGGILQGDSF